MLANKHGVAAVLDGGDLFHHKAPSKTSHGLLQTLTEAHSLYPCPVLQNVGNHDVKYGDLAYLNESPLGVLMSTRGFLPCYDQHEVFISKDGCCSPRVNGLWIAGAPSKPPVVQIVGIPYHGTRYDLTRFSRLKREAPTMICMVHCLASPDGGTMYGAEDILSYASLDAYAPDAFCFGHWHSDQGVTRTPKGKLVVNVGSMTRSSLHDTQRAPKVVLLTIDKPGLVEGLEIPLEVAPATEVFNLEQVERGVEQEEVVERVVADLLGTLQVKQDRSLLEEARSWILPEGLPPSVHSKALERVVEYLERARREMV